LAVYKSDRWVIRILNVEAIEMEHVFIVFAALIVELVGFAEGVH